MAMNTSLLLKLNVLVRFNFINSWYFEKKKYRKCLFASLPDFLAFLHIIEQNFYKKKTFKYTTQSNIKDRALGENS